MSRGSTPRAAAASASEPTRPWRVTVYAIPDAVSAADRALLTSAGHGVSVGPPDLSVWSAETITRSCGPHGTPARGQMDPCPSRQERRGRFGVPADVARPRGPRAWTRRAGGYHRFAWTREDHDLREWFAGECAARGLDLVDRPDGQPVGLVGRPGRGRRRRGPGRRHRLPPRLGARRRRLRRPAGRRRLRSPPSTSCAHDGFHPDAPRGRRQLRRRGGRPLRRRLRRLTGHHRRARCRPRPRAHRPRRRDDGRGHARAPVATRPTSAATTRPSARIGTFVELHVEQGRALVDLGHPVGVGSDIWPHGRWRVDLPGEANHAGTTAPRGPRGRHARAGRR